jgi:CDP-diglyceride synthetase
MKTTFEKFSAFMYLSSTVLLGGISLIIMLWAIYEIFIAIQFFSPHKEFISIVLQSVGAVIVAVAIIDVAKYMIEEEVFRSKELRDPKEARETLTKITTIISIAVSVEGIVYIFKAGAKDLSLLIYPSILILTAALTMVGLGIYQKLSLEVENEEKEKTVCL